jgi:aspartate/methionine/tyrosine aminotransferase
MMGRTSSTASLAAYEARVEEARAGRQALVDFTSTIAGLEAGGPSSRATTDAAPVAPVGGPPGSREAVALHLRGKGPTVSPDRVVVAPSPGASLAAVLDVTCAAGDEVLVPVPARPAVAAAARARSVQARTYPLRYDGRWRIDRDALRAAVTPRTRLVLVGSPCEPTGAVLSHEELAFVEELCAARELVLVGDEVLADTAFEPGPSVVATTRCPALQLSGALTFAAGVPEVALAWIAAAGPERRAGSLVTALEARVAAAFPGAVAQPFRVDAASLADLRARLLANRGRLSSAAVGEAPWAVLNGGGGSSAVLQVGLADDELDLCLALLEDGLVVRPSAFYGFEGGGLLALSLLPDPLDFARGLDILERRLRTGVSG